MKDDTIGGGKKGEATPWTVGIQVNGNGVCQDESLRWAAFVRIPVFYLLPLVFKHVEHPEIIHIFC